MKFREIDNQYLLRLEKGEELVAVLTGFCAQHDIKSGWINGLGGVQRATLGYYNLAKQKYVYRRIKDAVELVSLTGNIAEVDGKPFPHLHAVVSDKNNKASGGHVHHVIAGATIEIRLSVLNEKLERKSDEAVGLRLLDL